MGGIYHEGDPYSRQMVVDSVLSAVSNNPLKNRAVTSLIDDVIAPVEGANASQAYSAGDELILNNLLYKAKSAIAQDTPFDAGSSGNIELAGSIAEQLKSLFDGADKVKIPLIYNANTNYTDSVLRLFIVTGSVTSNTPTTSGNFWIFEFGTGQFRRQIAFDDVARAMWTRYKNQSGAVWDVTWKQIYGSTILTGTNMISGAMSGNGTQYTLGKITGMSKGVYVTVFKCSVYLTSGSSGDALFAALGGRTHLFSSSTSALPIGIETTYLLNVTSDNYTWEPSGTFYGSGSYTISGTPSLTAIKVA